MNPSYFLERPEPRLIYSTCHDVEKRTGVRTPAPASVHERDVARAAAAGLHQACSQVGVEMIDLVGEPLDNWSGARQLVDIAMHEERQALALEIHMNSGWQPGWQDGMMMFHPVDFRTAEIEDLLRLQVAPRIPPCHWIGSVGMPEAQYPFSKQRYNWAFLRSMAGRPSLLIELGFVENAEFCSFIESVNNQASVGKLVGDALCEWLLRK
jgi:hypothetical protein